MKFLASMLSTEGKISSNRTCLFLTLAFVLVWHTSVVFKTGAIPDLAGGWNALIVIFVGGSFGGKITDVATNVTNKKAAA